MLVLSRKTKQQLKLGDNITITVLRIKGNTIRLGIEAPQDVRVIRGELDLKLTSESEPDQATIAVEEEKRPDLADSTKRLDFNIDNEKATFPSTIDSDATRVAEDRPLKSFMPRSVREVVGNISV